MNQLKNVILAVLAFLTVVCGIGSAGLMAETFSEVPSFRTNHSKTFRSETGIYRTVVYLQSVNLPDDNVARSTASDTGATDEIPGLSPYKYTLTSDSTTHYDELGSLLVGRSDLTANNYDRYQTVNNPQYENAIYRGYAIADISAIGGNYAENTSYGIDVLETRFYADLDHDFRDTEWSQTISLKFGDIQVSGISAAEEN